MTAGGGNLRGRGSALLKQAVIVGLLTLLAFGGAAAGSGGGTTDRVSVDSAGSQADAYSQQTAISANGRLVAFESYASNLVAGDTNTSQDIFVHDRVTGSTERVSVANDGAQFGQNSSHPTISADGRDVAFDFGFQVYVRDRQTGTTELISADGSGDPGDSFSTVPSISADGRFVAFASAASNLVPGDTNNAVDVFVRDRLNHTTQRVSVSSSGGEANGNSHTNPHSVAISADGNVVGFTSVADNLVVGDANGTYDNFVHDRQTGVTERVDVDGSGSEITGSGNYVAVAVDGDGGKVAFESDYSGTVEVYVRDRSAATTELASADDLGSAAAFGGLDPSISANGRFVSFRTASALVTGDTNSTSDVYVRDLLAQTTTQASVDSAGNGGNDYSELGALDADGSSIAFASFSSNLVSGDTNNTTDVFAHDFTASATPPGAPTNVVAAAGDGTASVSWVAPAAGSSPIDHFTVVPHDLGAGTDGTAVTSSTTTATAAGLTNGHHYTFTVTATSTDGTGPSSPASNAVTPQAGAPPPATASGTATSGSSTTVSTGSDPAATGDTSTSISVPSTTGGGPITVAQTSTSEPAPTGYLFGGVQVDITAPAASPGSPLTLVFTFAPATGQTPDTAEIYRAEGVGSPVLVADCSGNPGEATPDPCVAGRQLVTLGAASYIQVTVLTSSASHWNSARPKPGAVKVSDSGFTPQALTVTLGATVNWTFAGKKAHSATDTARLGSGATPLFDSSAKSSGSYAFGFRAAGTYAYASTVKGDSMSGTVAVPVLVTPTSGSALSTFGVVWGLSAPAGYVFDVQYRFRPARSTGWKGWNDWKPSTTHTAATFVPTLGPGTYAFHSRLRNAATNRASSYSPDVSISVS